MLLTHTPALEVWLPFVYFSTLRRKPVVFSVHDIFPEVGIRLGIFRSRWVVQSVGWLERYCLKRAIRVRILSKSFAMPLITQAETLDPFLHLHEGLAGATYASYVVELLDRFTYEEGENRGLYRLLTDTLSRLCRLEERDLVLRYYELRLLDLVGFRPQLFQCVRCGSEIRPEDQFFSVSLGGAICPRCGKQSEAVQPISLNGLRYLRHFQRSSFAEAGRARLTPEINRELETIMQHYMTYLLEHGLNTPAFLRRLRKDVLNGDDYDGSNIIP